MTLTRDGRHSPSSTKAFKVVLSPDPDPSYRAHRPLYTLWGGGTMHLEEGSKGRWLTGS